MEFSNINVAPTTSRQDYVYELFNEECVGDNLLAKLKLQRENGKFCNVVFHVQHPDNSSIDITYHAHKNVLAAYSPYFDSILKTNRVDREHVSVYCDNHKAMGDLLDYIYTGSISISHKNVAELLTLANCFLMDKIKNYCSQFMERYLNVGNCLGIKELADKSGLVSLSTTTIAFIQSNLYSVLQQPEILDFSQQKLENFLACRTFDIPSSLMLHVVVKWTAHKLQERESLFNLLLMLLTPANIDLQIASKIIEHESLFQQSEMCLFLILDFFRQAGASLLAYTDVYQTLSEKLMEQANNDNINKAADLLDIALNSEFSSTLSSSNVPRSVIESKPLEETLIVRLKAPLTGKAQTIEKNDSNPPRTCSPENPTNAETLAIETSEENNTALENMNGANNEILLNSSEPCLENAFTGVSCSERTVMKFINDTQVADEITEIRTRNQGRPSRNNENDGDIGSNDDDIDCDSENDPDFCPSEMEEKIDQRLVINIPQYPPKSKNQRKRGRPRKMESHVVSDKNEENSGALKLKITKITSEEDEICREEQIAERFPLCEGELKKSQRLKKEKSKTNGKKENSEVNVCVYNEPSTYTKNRTKYSCDICHFSTRDKNNLERHVDSNHSVTFECNRCEFRTTWSRGYYRHMKTHFPGPPFKCDFDFCEYSTERIQQVLYHRMRHTDERPFPCDQCGMRFRTKNNAVTHMRCHTGEKPFQCSECNRCFATKSTLDQHQATHSNNRPFLCDICGFSTKYQSHLISHKRLHSGDVFRCQFPDCKYFTPKRSQLNAHMRIHSAIRSYICCHCSRAFVEKSHLVRHERIHLDEKPFKCDLCDYGSSRRDKLKEHVLKYHSDNDNDKTVGIFKQRKPRKQSPGAYNMQYPAVIDGGHTYLNLQPSNLNSTGADYEIVKRIEFSDVPGKTVLSLEAATASIPISIQNETHGAINLTAQSVHDLLPASHSVLPSQQTLIVDAVTSGTNTSNAFHRLANASVLTQQVCNSSQYPQTDIGGLSAFMALF